MDPTPLELEQHLQQHGGALRRLARELVHDAAAADDAVQETWLQAAQRPPQDGAQVGGWLVTVLRRIVLRSRRGERRRATRERSVAREPVAPDHAEVAARTEVTQRLLAALQELDAPYRETIWQRYFEDLPPRAIALRAGVPVATVKSRLQRGLQQLRERLGEGGESSDWRGALAGAFGFEVGKGAAAAGTVAAWQGGLLMAAWTKGVAAVAVVAIAAVWWWWPSSAVPGTDRQPPSSLSIAASPSASMDTPSERVAVGIDPQPEPVMQRAADTPPVTAPALAHVRGRVVAAETGQPLAGVQVELSTGKLDRQAKANPSVLTGADGVFEFEVRVDTGPRLSLSRDDRAGVSWLVRRLVAGEHEAIGDVRMAPGRRLRGRLVDEGGGAIPAQSFVEARPLARAAYEREGGGYTEADGTFVLRAPISLGPCEWALGMTEFELVEPQRTEVTLDGPDEVVLLVRRRAQIRGIVVDEAGRPVAGVRLSDQPGPGMVTVADAGTFTMRRGERSQSPATTIFIPETPGCASHPPLLDVPWGTDNVRIQLRRLPPFAIQVLDAEGEPIERFGVVVVRQGSFFPSGKVRHRDVHDGGVLAVDEVEPDQTTLRIVPSERSWTPSDAILASGPQPLRIVLQKRVPVRVFVRRGERPMEGVDVQLVRDPRPPGSLLRTKIVDPTTDDDLYSVWVQRISAGTTDAAGSVSLLRDPDLTGSSLRLQVQGEPVLTLRDLVLAEDGTLPVQLPSFGGIAGAVQLRGRAHRTLRIEIPSLGLTGNEALPVGPDGTFVVREVPSGPYRIDLQLRLGTAATLATRTVEVQAGDATGVTFDLAESPISTASGTVRAAKPLPPGLEVTFFLASSPDTLQLLNRVEVDANGAFANVELVPGSYRVAMRGKPAQPFDVPALEPVGFEVVAGQSVPLDLTYEPRRLAVRMQRPDGGVVRRERVLVEIEGVTWPSGASRIFTPMVDEVLVLDPVPAVPMRFRNWADGSPWSTAVSMPPDRSEAEVTVVLPDPPR